MPELPEVETTRLSLESLIGKTVSQVDVSQPKLRWPIPDDIDRLVGCRLEKTARRAKYLILTFSQSGAVSRKLIVHLGMSGSLQQRDLHTTPLKHDHAVVYFDATNIRLCYHDPRRFGAILWYDEYADKLLNHLGPEPLSEHFTAEYLQQYCAKTTRAIKAVIMDQACVVGVGNIYATESLYFSNLHPLMPANQLTLPQAQTLVTHIQSILANAIRLGGSTLRDYTHSDGKTGYFQQTLAVYGRHGQPCHQCNTPIENIKITGRASAYCPQCQKSL